MHDTVDPEMRASSFIPEAKPPRMSAPAAAGEVRKAGGGSKSTAGSKGTGGTVAAMPVEHAPAEANVRDDHAGCHGIATVREHGQRHTGDKHCPR